MRVVIISRAEFAPVDRCDTTKVRPVIRNLQTSN